MNGNVFKIAKKEFEDLTNSKLVFIIITVYILLIIKTVYDCYIVAPEIIKNDTLDETILMGLWYVLTAYGSLVCIVIGYSSISSERKGNAINTLIIKPVYRDTIINGKLIGTLGFITGLFCIATIIYSSITLIFYSNYINMILPIIVLRMPVILFLSLVYVMVFLSLSMLISIIVRNQAMALILGVIVLSLSHLVPDAGFSWNISLILGIKNTEISNIISHLSPDGLSLALVDSTIFDPAIGIWSALQSTSSELITLILYMVIAIILNYIIFIRSDIS